MSSFGNYRKKEEEVVKGKFGPTQTSHTYLL